MEDVLPGVEVPRRPWELGRGNAMSGKFSETTLCPAAAELNGRLDSSARGMGRCRRSLSPRAMITVISRNLFVAVLGLVQFDADQYDLHARITAKVTGHSGPPDAANAAEAAPRKLAPIRLRTDALDFRA
jgi:hypothetical protein